MMDRETAAIPVEESFRFEVALSFAGDDKRPKVRRVAEILREKLGPRKVFFDEWFEAEIAGQDASSVLQNIYRRQTRLVVTCVCQRYAEKPWTQDEWRAIQSFERTLRDAGDANLRRMRFLPLRFGDGEVDGLFDTAIVPDVRERSPEEIASLILERLRLSLREALDGGPASSSSKPAAASDIEASDRQNTRAPRPNEKRPHRNSWLSFTGIAFALSFVTAAAFVGFAPLLQKWGLERRIYFLVLFPLALAAAAFLFGALRSTASFEVKRLGSTLKLGGPVVVFALVLIGGYALTNPESSLSLVVRVNGPSGEPVKQGSVTIDFGPDRKGPAAITDRGEAYFPVVPSSFVGKDVQVRVNVPGYSLKGSETQRLDASSVLRLTLEKIVEAPLKLAGLVQDENGEKVPSAQITLPTLQLRGESNRDGYFELKVSADGPTDALLRVEKKGFRTLEQYVSVGNSVLILSLERTGSQAVGHLKE